MSLAPRQFRWRSVDKYACPVCPYDAAAYSTVEAHIQAKHQNIASEDAPPLPTMELSLEPVAVQFTDPPLISCVMVTKDRRKWVRASIQYFLAQTYPNKQLVVVDDGQDKVEDLCTYPSITYIRSKAATIGRKRNIGCQAATGEFIATWDDDEWQSPNRLALQYMALPANKSLCGIYRPIWLDVATGKLYMFGGGRPSATYCSGSTMFFRKSLWASNRFPDQQIGEDTVFCTNTPQRQVHQMEFSGFNVSYAHPGNTVQKELRFAPYVELPGKFPLAVC